MAELLPTLGALAEQPGQVARRSFSTVSADGAPIELQWFSPEEGSPGPAVIHAHGGGMVAGSVELFAPWITGYVARSGVPFLSVEYRLAPQAQGTTPAEDVYAGLTWLLGHSAELGVDPSRIGLLGESAGGGIVAGTAALARQRGVQVARQILIYPMLDDRNVVPDRQLAPTASWPYSNNETGWRSLLGPSYGAADVPAVAAPARLKEFAGLPPTYVEVGELDIFRDEDVTYARNLWQAGAPVELHVHPGVVHGFDQYAPKAAVTRRAMADRIRVLRTL